MNGSRASAVEVVSDRVLIAEEASRAERCTRTKDAFKVTALARRVARPTAMGVSSLSSMIEVMTGSTSSTAI
jgi:hypothetical protein